ncbi:hypothetical protein Tsubulata_026855 [Turnera subulata]|uniref:Uncharacterized protein n=1 Tax=Turnera subulata TaxID=218843 RepID=A0A9Q0GC14_9ROSI|nr:hypothetical protein Tsubulata_026855 [Turnera subulata]
MVYVHGHVFTCLPLLCMLHFLCIRTGFCLFNFCYYSCLDAIYHHVACRTCFFRVGNLSIWAFFI